MPDVYLGLGTNLGRRYENLQEAIRRLAQKTAVTAISPVYETAAWGETDQPPFLNACVALKTDLPALEFLDYVKQIEGEIGRTPTYRWGPRLIDIDILFYGDQVIQNERLTIPHPGLQERAFVLAPLADITPELRHPQTGQTVTEMLAQVSLAGVTRLERPLW